MNNELKILKAHEFQMRNIENLIKKMYEPIGDGENEDEYMENEEIDEVIERERQEQSE